MTATLVDGYRQGRELGSGASGRVVAAVHEATGRPVAIKFLAGHLVAQERFRVAFREEARLLGELDSPHIVRLFEYIESQSQAAIVMELVEGCTLRDLIERHGPTGPQAALTVLKGSLSGLSVAHRAGVVHRDFKPGNILITEAGVSRLTDFGIALRSGDSSVSGTPLYMAPEQWRGAPADPSADVYAATAVFFECLTGRSPYNAPSRPALALAHAQAPIPAELAPEPLRPLFLRGLAKDPADRPRSAEEFLGELHEAARRGYGDDWEGAGLAVLGAAAGSLIALGGVAAQSGGTAAASASTGRTALRLSRKGLLKSTPAKVTAGIAAGAVAVGGVAVGVTLTSGHHSPRPVAQTKPLVPIVTVATQGTPVQVTTGSGYVTAQYPVVSGLRDAALQQRVNAALQRPFQAWAAAVAKSAKEQNTSAKDSKSAVSEQTTAVQAGTLLSVTYRWAGPDNLYGGGGQILVIRLDTGQVVPEATILTAQAATAAGSQRVATAFTARNRQVAQYCAASFKPSVFARGIKSLGTRQDYYLQLGLAPTGVDFFLYPGAQDCGAPPTVLPFAELTGLVDPQILRLATTRRPA